MAPRFLVSHLKPLLTGKGLDVYDGLPVDQSDHYSILKRAILRRYHLSEEGFRTKFRQTTPAQGESVLQYVAKLKRYLDRWLDMADVNNLLTCYSESSLSPCAHQGFLHF